jgi:hypothetical protein
MALHITEPDQQVSDAVGQNTYYCVWASSLCAYSSLTNVSLEVVGIGPLMEKVGKRSRREAQIPPIHIANDFFDG